MNKSNHPKRYIRKTIIIAVVFILFIFAANPALIPFTSAEFKTKASESWGSMFGDVSRLISFDTINLAAIVKLIAMVLFIMLVYNAAHWVMTLIKPKTGRGRSLLSMLDSSVHYLLVIIGLIWGLALVGVNVTAIFAGVGVLALVISLGAESLIEDVITGIFLVLDEQFNVGDIIEIDGFRGVVERIGVRSTYIKDNGGNIQILNNSSIRKVLNRSAAASIAVCDVSIAYSAELEKAEKIIEAALPRIEQTRPDIFKSIPKYIGVQELGDSAVVLRVIAEVAEKDVYSAPRVMRRELKLALDAGGIEIPFPQVVVHSAKD